MWLLGVWEDAEVVVADSLISLATRAGSPSSQGHRPPAAAALTMPRSLADEQLPTTAVVR
jgi:hypothetical protein